MALGEQEDKNKKKLAATESAAVMHRDLIPWVFRLFSKFFFGVSDMNYK